MTKVYGSIGAAGASAILQGSTIIVVFAFKYLLSDSELATFFETMAWASVIGSGATLRLEVLLFQKFTFVNRESLISTFGVAFLFVVLGIFSIQILSFLFHFQSPPLINFVFLSLAFCVIEAQAFLSVQLGRGQDLIITRLVQASGIALTIFALFSEQSADFVFLCFSLSMVLPCLFWVIFIVVKVPGKFVWCLPENTILLRGFYLAIATSVNTLYVSLAVIVAGQTQSDSMLADFGFIQRLLTGPITFIRHFYSHSFIGSVISAHDGHYKSKLKIWKITRNTLVQSVITYMPFCFFVVFVVLFFDDLFGLEQPHLVFSLALVTVLQAGVNSISGIRVPLGQEGIFLKFDIFRLVFLFLTIGLSMPVAFDLRFSLASFFLYSFYIYFIRRCILFSSN